MSGIAEDRKLEIQKQLDRILSSAAFSGSERHRRFLGFVVNQALKGDTDKLNEFVLGFEVFNKNESFDPRIDSIVRVEARRLRDRLKKYYEDEGRNDPIVISLRPRSFVPEFQEPSPAPAPAAARAGSLRAWLPSHKLAAIVMAAVLFGSAVTAVLLSLRWRRPSPPPAASILVLPFQNLAPAPGQEALGDAIADALITGLAGGPGLRVISRGSGIQFKESGRPPFPFATDLHVDYIVEGTIQADAVRARISAKMTDVHTQSYVWASTRETKLSELPELEREMTTAISSRIRIPLPPDAGERVVRRRPANWQAYAAFLKGQYYWYQQEPGNIEKSIALFEQAARDDPNYAPAWAWLAQGYYLLALFQDGRDAAIVAKGSEATRKALALDDTLAEAHAAAGTNAALEWDWNTAGLEFRRAIELNPDWAQGHLLYSMMYLVPAGRMSAAVGEMFRARELDPLTRITRAMLAEVLYFNREYTRAIAESEDLRKPSTPSPDDRRYFLSLSLSGQTSRALTEMRRTISAEDDRSPAVAVLGYLFARNGDLKQAAAIRSRLLKNSTAGRVSPLSIALVSVGLGDKDEAFRQLRLAVAHRIPALPQAIADPALDPLRSDPRYTEILRGVGLKSSN